MKVRSGEVAVHVEACAPVAPDLIADDDGVHGGVGDVDTVVIRVFRVVRAGLVALDAHVVAVAGEDPPGPAVAHVVVADYDVAARDSPDAGPIDVPARVVHREAVYDDVARPFEVDPVGGFGVAARDNGARVSSEGDRLRRRPVLGGVPAKLKASVRPGPDDDGVAGADQACGPLDRPEGRLLRPRRSIAPTGRDVVRAGSRRGNLSAGRPVRDREDELRRRGKREERTPGTKHAPRHPACPHPKGCYARITRFEPVCPRVRKLASAPTHRRGRSRRYLPRPPRSRLS